MNSQSYLIRFTAPVFVAGVALVSLTLPSLEKGGHLVFEPNPGALAKSPYGRTVGMALQGPVNRFWDRGIGATEGAQELITADRPDQKLFNHVVQLREQKTAGKSPAELQEIYQDFTMAKIERKLEMAWKMDPRNFGNYAIYQMFLWEGFAHQVIKPQMPVKELSLATLEICLQDKQSPNSLLTAGQAAYDLVFAARTSQLQDPAEAREDIQKYSQVLPQVLADYKQTVALMKKDGSWDAFSEVKRTEFGDRQRYLEHLNNETTQVLEQLTSSDKEEVVGGRQS